MRKSSLAHLLICCARYFNRDYHLLCAHNGKEFDFPFLSRRMLVQGITLPDILDTAA